MYSVVMCGPLIYRTALLEHLRLLRGDIRVSSQSNHPADAPAIIAHAVPDAAIVISAEVGSMAVALAERLRKVDLQVQVVWWALTSEFEGLATALKPFEIRVVSWEASVEEIIGALGISVAPFQLSGGRPRLTQQELVILQLAADGFSNKAIAHRLGVAENTVKNHFRHIGAKFNTSSRAQAVWQAVQWGYLMPTELRA